MTYAPEYATFVQSRLKDGGDILKTVTPTKANLLHLALGVAGECGELILGVMAFDTKNCKEEVGDNLFFIQAFENAIGVEVKEQDLNVDSLDGALLFMSIWAGEIVDAVKKNAIYNKPLDAEWLAHSLGIYKSYLREACKWIKVSFSEAQSDNVEKLTKRYASGYSDTAAQERKDKV